MTNLPVLTPEAAEALRQRVHERIAARRAKAGQYATPTPAPYDAIFAAGQRWLATLGYTDEGEASEDEAEGAGAAVSPVLSSLREGVGPRRQRRMDEPFVLAARRQA